jgi:triacylglycerol lipase
LIELTPQQAALIAKNVYNVLPVSQDMEHIDLGIDDLFSIESGSRFTGKSGCIIFNSKTGFGYVAKGVSQRANEALVAIRGTALGVDWITDFDAGIDIGPSGYPVHSGFSKAYKSFRMALDAELDRLKPSSVHVVGHSLGGALATLAADHIRSRGGAVKLYTFGAPRAGTIPHANFLTGSLGEEDIYRVYHVADPVAMVPIFPFRHVAVTNNGYLLNWPGTISFDSHLMKGYVRSIGSASGWRGLRGWLRSLAGSNRRRRGWTSLMYPEAFLCCLELPYG